MKTPDIDMLMLAFPAYGEMKIDGAMARGVCAGIYGKKKLHNSTWDRWKEWLKIEPYCRTWTADQLLMACAIAYIRKTYSHAQLNNLTSEEIAKVKRKDFNQGERLERLGCRMLSEQKWFQEMVLNRLLTAKEEIEKKAWTGQQIYDYIKAHVNPGLPAKEISTVWAGFNKWRLRNGLRTFGRWHMRAYYPTCQAQEFIEWHRTNRQRWLKRNHNWKSKKKEKIE